MYIIKTMQQLVNLITIKISPKNIRVNDLSKYFCAPFSIFCAHLMFSFLRYFIIFQI
jgi:hypothetical protein